MGELLPGFWSCHREEDIEGQHEVKVRRSRKVTDIFTWLQCFGSYVSVHAQHTPSLIPKLMAYMAAMIRVSQDYAGLACGRYDAVYQRPRCEIHFVTTHSTKEYVQQGDPDPGIQDCLKVIEMAVLVMTSNSPTTRGPTPKTPNLASGKLSNKPCWKWSSYSCIDTTMCVAAVGEATQ